MAFIQTRSRRLARLLEVIVGIIYLISPRPVEAEGLSGCRKRLSLSCGLFEVRAIVFSSDSSILASASADGAIRIWDVTRGLLLRETSDLGGKPVSISFSPDGSTLAVGLVRDARNLSKAHNFQRSYWGITLLDTKSGLPKSKFWGEHFEGKHIAFSSDGKTIVTSRHHGLTCWDLATDHRTDVLRHDVSGIDRIAIALAGDRMAFADIFSNVYIYEVKSNKFVDIKTAHRRPVSALSFTGDGSLLVSGSLDHEVKVWQTSSGKLDSVFHHTSEIGCRDRVLDLNLTLDSKKLRSAHLDGLIKSWDLLGRRFLQSSELSLSANFEVTSMTFSPDGKSLGVIGYVPQVGIGSDLSPSWEIVVWDLPPNM
jgi:WD40 repeat protein